MSDISKHKHIITHVMLPLLIGGMIYLIFRNNTLIMFKWVDFIGFTKHINNLREIINPIKLYIPKWVFYSLPDGLWTYAFTSSFIIFNDKNIIWLVMTFVLSIGVEILQGFQIFPGTYDPLDLLFCIIGYVLPFLVFKSYKRSCIALNH